MSQPDVHVFYGTTFWGLGPPETCYRICSHWPGQGLATRVFTAAALRPDPAGILNPALPAALPRFMKQHIAASGRLDQWLERRSATQALAAIKPGDLCYAWPGTPIEVLQAARDRGGLVVLEFINTHTSYAKAILDAECDRIGAPRYGNYEPEGLVEDLTRLAHADAAFAPGPFVQASIEAHTPSPPPILPVSYGAHLPDQIPARPLTRDRPLRVLFVGTLAIRKGIHLLLEAWSMAGLDAELWLAGRPEPYVETAYLSDLPASVKRLGFIEDMGALYADVDVFVFPSLEEGGPQVTYEAAAYGLPLVVTPMGGGWIAREDDTALVVSPDGPEELASALTRVVTDDDLRARLGAAAGQAAGTYRWDRVADRRRQALLEFAGAGSGATG